MSRGILRLALAAVAGIALALGVYKIMSMIGY